MPPAYLQVNFRMPSALKEKLEAAAVEAGRSVTAEIVFRLERSFDPPDAQLDRQIEEAIDRALARRAKGGR